MSEYKVDVKIAGKTYTLVTDEAKDNIKDIAEIFDRKIQEVKSNRLTFDRQLVLAGLNITDDFYKLSKQYDSLKEKSEEPCKYYPTIKEEVEKLKEENKKLLDENEKNTKAMSDLKIENTKLEQSLNKYRNSRETIEKLKNEVKRLQVEVMDLSKENDMLKGKL